MDITWSEIASHLGALAANANFVSLVVGGGGLTLFRDHFVSPEYVESHQRTIRAILQDKLTEKHRQAFNWHAAKIVGADNEELILPTLDPVQAYTDELFRSRLLLRRLERAHNIAGKTRVVMFSCTIAALVGFLGSIAIETIKPFFFLWAVVLLIVQIIAVIRSRGCKLEVDRANESA